MKKQPIVPPPSRQARRRALRVRSHLFAIGAFAASSAIAVRPVAAQTPTTAQSPAPQAGQNAAVFVFDLAPGMAGDVMAAFERATGLRVTLANPDLATLPVQGVSGRMTPATALRQLLAGTSLGATFSDTGVLIDIAGLEQSVNVMGARPTVSSPRYTVPLRDIAQTVALVPRTVIEQQGATTLTDALRNVPGITLQAGEGGGASNTAGDMFNMRGFNASNSLFVDNVRDDGLISRDVFNIEQVEVFMGPTGSDVGRGTAAGYVNMQTKTPHLGTESSALLSVGSANQGRMTADFNWGAPMTATGGWLSKSAVRLNTLWQDRGVPGRDLTKNESAAIAPAVALGLGTPTRVMASAQVVRHDNLPDYGIPTAAWSEELLATTVVQATQPVRQANYYGSPRYDYDRADQNSYLARVEHDMNRNVTLRNQTRYNEAHRDAVVTAIQNVAAYNPATGLVTVARQGNERENSILSNQTTLVDRFKTGMLRHAVSAGLEFSRETAFAPTLTGLGTRAPVSLFSPNPNDPVTGFAPARTLAKTDGSTNTAAVYAFDTIELNQRWQVSGGLRWERYDTAYQAVDVAGVTTTDLAADDTLLSGRASVLFRLNDAANVYLSYGTTVTPPGSANFQLSASANNVNNPNVKPQRSANLEAGAKWDAAGGRLSLNGAAFRTRNENVIYTLDAVAIPPLFNQDDEQLVRGATVGALGRVTDRWEVIANAAYLDAEQVTQAAATNGLRLTLTPAWSGSLWSTYRVAGGLTLGGGIRRSGVAYVNTANTIRMPGYALVDALAEYAVNSHLSLRVNVNNVTDAVYVRAVNNNGGRYSPGNPRSVLVTSNVRF